MKKEISKEVVSEKRTMKKLLIVVSFYALSILIMFMGIFFGVFSLVNGITLKVLNNDVSGAVFGLLVLYVGIRYYLSIEPLKEELYLENSNFSWSNFKKFGKKKKKELVPNKR